MSEAEKKTKTNKDIKVAIKHPDLRPDFVRIPEPVGDINDNKGK